MDVQGSGERDDIHRAIAGLEAQRALLGDFVVNPAIAALRQKLEALVSAEVPQAEAEGERKLVTIMFADLSGFTALSERLDPEELREIVNTCFEVLVPIVERHGGVVDKFMGDAVMALFGARVANEDDPQRALHAALEMKEALDAIAAERKLPLGVHFGINTGPVVTGVVGSSGQHAYSVMGDAVNLAARLEDLSETGEILVGPFTRRQAAGQFDFEERPPVVLKGKEQPVPIFRLLGRKRDEGGRGRLAAPLLGRRAELDCIMGALERVGNGHGGAICIVGDAGLGKSRLLGEAWQRSPDGLRWMRVSPRRHGHASGFGAIRALLLQLLGFEADPGPEVLRATLREAVARQWGGSGGSEPTAHLAAMLGLSSDDESASLLARVPAELLHARFARTVAELLASRASERPTVIVWEDLHWADPSSLRLASSLFEAVGASSCLHLASSRPELETLSELAKAESMTVLTLEPIGPDASREMLRALLSADDLDEGFAGDLLARAEGNPFFLEELVQSLLDSGALVISKGRASAGPALSRALLPPTLQGVMMARLDRLTATEKRVVQTASVLGRKFDRQTLARMTNRPGELDAVLRKLEIIDIIRPAGELTRDCGSFKFKHAVTQEVAYGSLLLTTRRQLHRSAAEAIQAHAVRPAGLVPLLAYHYENSDAPLRAAPYLLESARLARESHAIGEALAAYGRVIAMGEPRLVSAGQMHVLAEAYAGRGELLQLSGRTNDALDSFAAALALVDSGDGLRRAGLLRCCGLTEMARRNPAAALGRFNEADEALGALDGSDRESAAWRREWIEIQLERLWALGWAGQFKEATRIADQVQEPVARHGDLGQRARLDVQQFIMRTFRENSQITTETIDFGRQALALSDQWGDPKGMMVARLWFAWGLLWTAAWDEAERELVEGLRLARFIGDVEYEVLSLVTLSCLRRLMDDPVETAALCPAALEGAERAEMHLYTAVVVANQAWVALREGNRSAARRLAEAAAATWLRLPYRVRWLAHWPLLALAMDAEDWTDAAEQARIILGREQYRMPPAIAAALDAALAALERDDGEAAAAAFEDARRHAEPLGMA